VAQKDEHAKKGNVSGGVADGFDEAKGYLINIAPTARVCGLWLEPVEVVFGCKGHLGKGRRLEGERKPATRRRRVKVGNGGGGSSKGG
jgi:hypothetical protein